MKRVLQLVFLASVCALLGEQRLQAQTTQSEWWPEVDTYVKLNDELRLKFAAARATDGSTYNSTDVGAGLEITLKPILREKIKRKMESLDEAKRKYLTFGIGYRYYHNLDKPSENRVELELTPRYFLPWSILLSDRNRADLRVIRGNFSWRYRNRLTLERSFRIKSFRLIPFARGEVYYDSRYSIWNKNSYAFGAGFPIGKRIELEPYYQHDNDSRASVQHVNALGFTVYLYF